MKNWKNYTVNLGYVKQKSSKTFTFTSTVPLEISRVQPECPDCTKFIDYKDNTLTMKYDSPEFPKHILKSESIINKEIAVFYEDGTSDKLKFVGILKR